MHRNVCSVTHGGRERMESLIFLVSSYLPGEKRDHLSFPSFPILLYFPLNIIVRVLFFIFFYPGRPHEDAIQHRRRHHRV